MSKLVAFRTYERFRSAFENNNIDEYALNFIVDTGQLYTHGFYLNSVSFGAESNGGVPLTVAGISKTLSLSSHTHSNYLEKNANIDIGNYKIVSGNNDLLLYNNGLQLGDTEVPTYIRGAAYRDSYTILDTGNFSITNLTTNGTILSNVALFTYNNTKFLLDYVKRLNTSTVFNSLTSYTCLGTTFVDQKYYGFITFYALEGTLNSPWALLRIDIANKQLEYRTSQSTSWSSMTMPTIPVNALDTAGIVTAPTSSTVSKVWKTDANGNPGWRDENSNTFYNLRFLQVLGTDLMTYNSQEARTIVAGDNITFAFEDNILTIRSQGFTDTWRDIYVDQVSKLDTAISGKGINFKGANGTTLTFTAAGENDAYSTLLISSPSYSTATDLTLGLVKVGTTLDNVNGYTPVHINDGTIYYKNDTYTFSNLLFLQVQDTNLMTYNSLATKTILAGTGITFAYASDVLTISSAIYSTATSSVLGLVKIGDTLDDNTGYTAVKIDANGVIYYHDTTYTFSNLKFQNEPGVDLMTYNTLALKTIIAGTNITFDHTSGVLTISATDTTYNIATSSVAGLIKVGETLESTNGYTAIPIKDGVAYYHDTTYSFSNLQFLLTENNNLMTYNSQATRTIRAGNNITFNHSDNVLTITATDTTYSSFGVATDQAAGSAGLVPAPTAGQLGSSGYYLRADGTWLIPPNTWNPMTGASESNNGTVGYINATPPSDGYDTKFWRADGTWSIPTDTKYYLTLNGQANGTSSGTNLGTIYAPAGSGTGFLKCAVSGSTITWTYDNTTYATPDATATLETTKTITADTWMDTGLSNATTGLTTSGTYIVQVTYSNDIYSGVISWYAGTGGAADEVALHYAGDRDPGDARVYLKTEGGKLYIAANGDVASLKYIIKIRKLI